MLIFKRFRAARVLGHVKTRPSGQLKNVQRRHRKSRRHNKRGAVHACYDVGFVVLSTLVMTLTYNKHEQHYKIRRFLVPVNKCEIHLCIAFSHSKTNQY